MQHTFGQNAKKAPLEDYGSQGCKNQSDFRNSKEYESVEAASMVTHVLEESPLSEGS